MWRPIPHTHTCSIPLALALGSAPDSSLRVSGIVPLNLEKVSGHEFQGSETGSSRGTVHRVNRYHRPSKVALHVLCALMTARRPIDRFIPQAHIHGILILYEAMTLVVANSGVNDTSFRLYSS